MLDPDKKRAEGGEFDRKCDLLEPRSAGRGRGAPVQVRICAQRRGRQGPQRLADAEDVVQGELVEAFDVDLSNSRHVRVEILVGGAVGQ